MTMTSMNTIASVRTLVLLALSLLAVACEETVDITDAVYRERFVVYGVLDAGREVRVTFTRTLPINEPYSAERAALGDVAAVVVVENRANGEALDTVPLVHTSGGRYEAPGLVVESGWRYRLEASWNGKSVRASTVVPFPAQIDSLSMVPRIYDYGDVTDTLHNLRALVRPRPEEVYLLSSADVDPRTGETIVHETYGGATLGRIRDTIASGHVELLDPNWGYRGAQPVAAIVMSYDAPYYDFQKTFYSYGGGGSPFSTGADNVHWTVEGDGIGLFIGRAVAERRL